MEVRAVRGEGQPLHWVAGGGRGCQMEEEVKLSVSPSGMAKTQKLDMI